VNNNKWIQFMDIKSEKRYRIEMNNNILWPSLRIGYLNYCQNE
jgi:hypothetical protein